MNGLKENECPDLLTLAKARGSVRSFKSSKVERAKVECEFSTVGFCRGS